MVRIFEKTEIRKHRYSKTWNFGHFGPQNLVGSIFIVFKRHDLTQYEFFQLVGAQLVSLYSNSKILTEFTQKFKILMLLILLGLVVIALIRNTFGYIYKLLRALYESLNRCDLQFCKKFSNICVFEYLFLAFRISAPLLQVIYKNEF